MLLNLQGTLQIVLFFTLAGEVNAIIYRDLPFVSVYTFYIIHTYAVSRTQQGKQKEPNVKTLGSTLFDKFYRHCELKGGTQRRTLSQHQSKEMEI